MSKLTYVLHTPLIRENACRAILRAEPGYVVTIAEPTRSSEQNAFFHSICSDIAKSGHPFAGKPRDAGVWKVLLISGHAIATKEGTEVLPGLEGEFVNIRESSARMSVRRAASLIEYAIAYCASNGIALTETRRGGFMEGEAA